MNFLDLFAQRLREKREQKKITQRELAERLNMCTRTVIEIEKCKSNPRFETVALISEEMDISLDGNCLCGFIAPYAKEGKKEQQRCAAIPKARIPVCESAFHSAFGLLRQSPEPYRWKAGHLRIRRNTS